MVLQWLILIATVLCLGYIPTIVICIRVIKKTDEKLYKIMKELGWLLALSPEEKNELTNAYLLLRVQERILQRKLM